MGKHLNLITLVFVLPHLYCSVFNIDQFGAQVGPKPHTCQIDPKFFGNRISSIAFVPVKHQTVVWVSIYCCLWARTSQDYLAVPLRVLKVVAESKPAGNVFKGGVIGAS